VLLLSDGAQTAGDIRPGPAAQRARRLGVPVSTVALGTGNAVVEVPRPGGLKERVVVAPDVQTLRVIARTTGGSFSEAPSAEAIREAAARPVRVVGVVPGVKNRLGDTRPVPHIYLPLGAHYGALLNIHVRTAGSGRQDADAVRAALRDTIRSADTKLALLALQSLDEARDSMPQNWIVRTAARTFGAFGAIALFMAAIGLYGVKAYLVARRTREIGIRMAIGAGAGDVIRMVLKEGAALLCASIALGFLLALAMGRAVGSLLVGVRPFDPLVLLVATLVLSAAVLSACYVPARRATRISPMTALRVE
jgi:hypothetical protein